MGTHNAQRFFKAIEKAGLKVEQSPDSNRCYVEGKSNYYGEFFLQKNFDGVLEVVCSSVCRKGDQSDATVDYFPQFYTETTKSFIQWLTK